MRGKGQTTSTDARSGWLRRLSRACWRYPRNLMLALAKKFDCDIDTFGISTGRLSI